MIRESRAMAGASPLQLDAYAAVNIPEAGTYEAVREDIFQRQAAVQEETQKANTEIAKQNAEIAKQNLLMRQQEFDFRKDKYFDEVINGAVDYGSQVAGQSFLNPASKEAYDAMVVPVYQELNDAVSSGDFQKINAAKRKLQSTVSSPEAVNLVASDAQARKYIDEAGKNLDRIDRGAWAEKVEAFNRGEATAEELNPALYPKRNPNDALENIEQIFKTPGLTNDAKVDFTKKVLRENFPDLTEEEINEFTSVFEISNQNDIVNELPDSFFEEIGTNRRTFSMLPIAEQQKIIAKRFEQKGLTTEIGAREQIKTREQLDRAGGRSEARATQPTTPARQRTVDSTGNVTETDSQGDIQGESQVPEDSVTNLSNTPEKDLSYEEKEYLRSVNDVSRALGISLDSYIPTSLRDMNEFTENLVTSNTRGRDVDIPFRVDADVSSGWSWARGLSGLTDAGDNNQGQPRIAQIANVDGKAVFITNDPQLVKYTFNENFDFSENNTETRVVYRDEDGKEKEVYLVPIDEQNRSVFAPILGQEQQRQEVQGAIEQTTTTPPTEGAVGQTNQESRLSSDFGGFSGINNLDHPYFQSNPVEFRYERVEGDLNTGSEPTRLVFENKPEGVHIGLLINNPGAITTTYNNKHYNNGSVNLAVYDTPQQGIEALEGLVKRKYISDNMNEKSLQEMYNNYVFGPDGDHSSPANTEKIIQTLTKDFGFEGITKDTTVKELKDMGITEKVLGLAIISQETSQFYDLASQGAFLGSYNYIKPSDTVEIQGDGEKLRIAKEVKEPYEGFMSAVSADTDNLYINVKDAYRTVKGQAEAKKYWTDRDRPNMAASPLKSNHGSGRAIDIHFSEEQAPKIYDLGLESGFVPTIPHLEYWHVDYSPELAQELKARGVKIKRASDKKASYIVDGKELSPRESFDFIQKVKAEMTEAQRSAPTSPPQAQSTPAQPANQSPTQQRTGTTPAYTQEDVNAGVQQGADIFGR
jgi:hypothetical protein